MWLISPEVMIPWKCIQLIYRIFLMKFGETLSKYRILHPKNDNWWFRLCPDALFSDPTLDFCRTWTILQVHFYCTCSTENCLFPPPHTPAIRFLWIALISIMLKCPWINSVVEDDNFPMRAIFYTEYRSISSQVLQRCHLPLLKQIYLWTAQVIISDHSNFLWWKGRTFEVVILNDAATLLDIALSGVIAICCQLHPSPHNSPLHFAFHQRPFLHFYRTAKII